VIANTLTLIFLGKPFADVGVLANINGGGE